MTETFSRRPRTKDKVEKAIFLKTENRRHRARVRSSDSFWEARKTRRIDNDTVQDYQARLKSSGGRESYWLSIKLSPIGSTRAVTLVIPFRKVSRKSPRN